MFWLFSKYTGCPSTHIEFFSMVALVISFLFGLYLSLTRNLNLGLLSLGAVAIAIPSYNYYHLYRQSLFIFLLLVLLGILSWMPQRYRRFAAILSSIFLALMHNTSFVIVAIFVIAVRVRLYLASVASSGVVRIGSSISRKTISIILCLLIASLLAIPVFVNLVAQPQLLASFLGLFSLESMSRSFLFQLIIQLLFLSALSLFTLSGKLKSTLIYNCYFIFLLFLSDLAIGAQQTFRIFWPAATIGYYFFCVIRFNCSVISRKPSTLPLG